MRVTKKDVHKLGLGARSGAFFYLLCVVLIIITFVPQAVQGDWSSVWTGDWNEFVVLAVAVLVGGHISGSIVLTGYAPWYLLHAHRMKNDWDKEGS